MLNKKLLNYTAGVVDKSSCICLCRKGKDRKDFYCLFRISNRNEKWITELRNRWNLGSVVSIDNYGDTGHTYYIWNITGKEIEILLFNVRPFIRNKFNKEKIKLALEFTKTIGIKGNIEKRIEIYKKFKELRKNYYLTNSDCSR